MIFVTQRHFEIYLKKNCNLLGFYQGTVKMINIAHKLLRISEIRRSLSDEMQTLYAAYYDGANANDFQRDLSNKNYASLFFDDAGELIGFSTLKLFSFDILNQFSNVIFSGDTILRHDYWGTPVVAKNWLSVVGAVKFAEPEKPLYWLLISKGHRTYRYLSAYAHEYFPNRHFETPFAVQHAMRALGKHMFAHQYDVERGIVRHSENGARLKWEYSGVEANKRNHPEVKFFAERNPDYHLGDELLCLCELSEGNLRPLARKYFTANYDAVQLEHNH